jgi:hypothetical protein
MRTEAQFAKGSVPYTCMTGRESECRKVKVNQCGDMGLGVVACQEVCIVIKKAYCTMTTREQRGRDETRTVHQPARPRRVHDLEKGKRTARVQWTGVSAIVIVFGERGTDQLSIHSDDISYDL